MKVWNVTEEQLRQAAQATNVSLYELRQDGRALRFMLRPDDSKRWLRRGNRDNRINAVCFHGHYAFMLALYDLAPDARIKSGLLGAADYTSRASLVRQADAIGDRNIGSQFSPLAYRDACDCFGEHDPDGTGYSDRVKPAK